MYSLVFVLADDVDNGDCLCYSHSGKLLFDVVAIYFYDME